MHELKCWSTWSYSDLGSIIVAWKACFWISDSKDCLLSNACLRKGVVIVKQTKGLLYPMESRGSGA